MKDIIKKTKEIHDLFPNKYDKRSRLLDLMEELGELAQAVHIVEGFKTTNDPSKVKTVDDVADGVCDILYELILLSQDYNLDLEHEYLSMLGRLKKRVASGEFD